MPWCASRRHGSAPGAQGSKADPVGARLGSCAQSKGHRARDWRRLGTPEAEHDRGMQQRVRDKREVGTAAAGTGRDRKLAQMLHASKRLGASHIRGLGHENAFVVQLHLMRWRRRNTIPVFREGIKSKQGTMSTVLNLANTARRRWERTIPGTCKSTRQEVDSPTVGSYWTLTASA
jgi:hypothetical protein